MKRPNRLITITAILLPLTGLLGGCSDDAGDSLTQPEADLAMSSVAEILDSAADQAVSQSARSDRIALAAEPVTLTVQCPDGGTASVAGDIVSPQEVTFSMELDGCVVGTLIMDGSIDSAVQVELAEITQSAVGSLSLSGPFEASCAIDLEVERGIASLSFSGTICGVTVQ